MFFIAFLFPLVVIYGEGGGAHSLDRDLIHAISESVEPFLISGFQLIQDLYTKRLTTDVRKAEMLLIGMTDSPMVKSLVSMISKPNDKINFGEMASRGFGDKYRTLLALRQRLFLERGVTASLHEHVIGWHRVDMLLQNIAQTRKFFKHQRALSILEDIAEANALELERSAQKGSEPEIFMQRMHELSGGIILPHTTDLLSDVTIGREIVLLLEPALVEELFHFTGSKSSFSECIFGQVKDPLRSMYFKQAFLHWRHFSSRYNELEAILPHLNPSKGIPKDDQDDVDQIMLNRMHNLSESMAAVSQYDHRATSLLLLSSWSLMQYLKYVSRLNPSQVYRPLVEEMLSDYSEGIAYFIRDVNSQIVPHDRLSLPKNKYRFCKNGPIVRDIILVSAPLPHGGEPFYHYTMVKCTNSLIIQKLANCNLTDVLVVLSKPAFSNPQLVFQFMSEIKSKFYCQ